MTSVVNGFNPDSEIGNSIRNVYSYIFIFAEKCKRLSLMFFGFGLEKFQGGIENACHTK
jgi:hypothetical protein